MTFPSSFDGSLRGKGAEIYPFRAEEATTAV